MAVSSEFYSREELLAFGFTSVGDHVQVSRKASFYAIKGSIGSHVRIDDFCVIKGRVTIGSYIHIAAYCLVSGTAGQVTFEDFSGLSNSVTIYTGSDNYGADALSNPTVPKEYTVTVAGDVRLGRACVVGVGSLLLPNTELGDACSIGAFCLVIGKIEPGAVMVNSGAKPRMVKKRDVDTILKKAEEVLASSKGQ